jgi:hypothetical protein
VLIIGITITENPITCLSKGDFFRPGRAVNPAPKIGFWPWSDDQTKFSGQLKNRFSGEALPTARH